MDTVETLKDIFIASGAGWVLWLLLALSVGSVAIAIERFVFFRTKSDDLRGIVGTLDAHLRSGDRAAALAELGKLRSAGAAVASAGLRLSSRGARAAEKGMESAMAIERKGLESRLAYLGTLGNNAPFIGLFGTVIGVILAFEALGAAPAAGTGPSQVASTAVMSAIAEALVATAVGIGVALPAVALYNYFQRRIDTILADAEALSSLVVAYLEDRSVGAAADEEASREAVERAKLRVEEEGNGSKGATRSRRAQGVA